MKAAVLTRTGKPLEIHEGLRWDELHPGQVLVRMAYSGVCRSQLMEARGMRGEDRYVPHLLGHEGSGVVESVGPGVTRISPGDKIVLTWIRNSGMESGGTVYRCGDRKFNAGSVTTFNQMAVVSENRCVRLPEGVPMDLAVLFGCALPTGAGMVLHQMKPKPADRIAFFGLGGIGLSALLMARALGCEHLIAVDVNDAKLKLAKELGAARTVNPSRDDLPENVDFSIEAGGSCETIERAFKAVRKNGGRCIFASHPPTGEKIRLDPHDLISGKKIEGSWGGQSVPENDIGVFAGLYRGGKLPLEKLLARAHRLEEINDVMLDLEDNRIFRGLIKF